MRRNPGHHGHGVPGSGTARAEPHRQRGDRTASLGATRGGRGGCGLTQPEDPPLGHTGPQCGAGGRCWAPQYYHGSEAEAPIAAPVPAGDLSHLLLDPGSRSSLSRELLKAAPLGARPSGSGSSRAPFPPDRKASSDYNSRRAAGGTGRRDLARVGWAEVSRADWLPPLV